MKILSKVSTIYPRDIIAIITLVACFILMALGINHLVAGITIMIITYYFSKRVYEERNPNGDINQKVKKLENKINLQPLLPQTPQNVSTLNQLGPQVIVKPSISS